MDINHKNKSRDHRSSLSVQFVDLQEFYLSLTEDILVARRSLHLTHLPEPLADRYEVTEYEAALARTIREGTPNGDRIRVKRMVAIPSLVKLSWVIRTLEEFAEETEFSVSLVREECNVMGRYHCPSRNLQIIDTDIVYEVNPVTGCHSPTDVGRVSLIYRDNIQHANMMEQAYATWWNACEKIKEGPKLTLEPLEQRLMGFRGLESEKACDEALGRIVGLRERTSLKQKVCKIV